MRIVVSLKLKFLVCTCVIHKRCKASVVTTCPGIRTCFEVRNGGNRLKIECDFMLSIVKNVLKSMFHIDLLYIHIDYLHFVIIVDRFYGAHGIKECSVEVMANASSLAIISEHISGFRMQIECS